MIAEVSGRLWPMTLLVRRLVSRGRPLRASMRLSPRFGYGRAHGRSRRRSGALIIEHDGLALALMTDASVEMEVDRELQFIVEPDHPVTISLSVNQRQPCSLVPPPVARKAAERDERGWRTWTRDIKETTPHHETVVRSLLTLRLLTYSPSGAPVAAPTTSLPELMGGSRNWDYRFAWPRDASIGVAALLSAGKRKEAEAFFAWLLHASRLSRPRIPALFTLDGRRGEPERELRDWPGYAGSRPVRVGNGAADQHQLDGYGWVVDAAWVLAEDGHRFHGETWRTIAGFADHVAKMWSLPDSGIWERRDEPRHHVHSKLMAWLALDRAARIGESRNGRSARRASKWRVVRDRIAEDVRSQGYDAERGCYTASYGSTDLDAAVLILPMVGVEEAGSPRVMSTVERIRTELGAGGPLIYRYLSDDGLPGREGAFLPCSFWLVQALAKVGRRAEAEDLFDQLIALGGPLSLFAEELDPVSGEQLGNFPQALTHATLLQAAFALREARVSS